MKRLESYRVIDVGGALFSFPQNIRATTRVVHQCHLMNAVFVLLAVSPWSDASEVCPPLTLHRRQL